jgi:protein TonB
VTGVALLHVAAGYALVTGLAATYIEQVMPVFAARNYPVEQPPPPTQPKPKPSPATDIQQTRVATPKPPLDLSASDAQAIIEIKLPPIQPPLGDTIRTDPPAPSTPTFPPQRAKPRGDPGGWATTNDYPARDLREGNQGPTRFSLVIGPDGRVQSCAIVRSSGFPGLDKATCDNVSRRARFDPATDGGGNRVTGTYSGSIRWVIPQD